MDKGKIDFVILWVDGNDQEWQKEKAKYLPQKNQDAGENRYRDWENLQYWFRGVEEFAPWVNKIHFVTWGHFPEWLNQAHPKLNLVEHKEFIPVEYLPTFNCNPIELNFHRIPGLSEQFVLFNDDCFLTRPVSKADFFRNDLPCDMFMEYPVGCSGHNEVFSHILVNNFNLIGRHFSRSEIRRKLKKKILSLKYGSYFFYNLLFYHLPFPNFFGLLTPHFAQPYLKKSFEEVWEAEEGILKETCTHRFRQKEDVTEYIFRLWTLMKGEFSPDNRLKKGKAYFLKQEDEVLYQDIRKQKYKFICINDDCGDAEYEIAKRKIIESFEQILPQKSEYEL